MSIQNWKFNTTDNGSFFWEAMTKTGEILGRSSQNFKSQNGAKYNADLLGRSGNFSQKISWDFMQDKENNWLWKADNTVNKENVAAAHKPFKAKVEAVQNAILFGYKGEFISLINSADVKDSNPNAKPSSTVTKTTIIAPTNDLNIVKTPSKDKYDERIYVDDSKSDSSSWWKWLVLGLIILGLLYWLLPMLTRQADTPSTNTSTSTSQTGILGALQNPNFGVLSGAIRSSNLLDTVNKSTPLTVIAPTNSAFQTLPADTLANIQKPENVNQLQTILRNHLFSGNINLNDLKDGSTIKSLAGTDLAVKIDNGKLFIDGIEIDKNIDASANGFSVYDSPKVLSIPAAVSKIESLQSPVVNNNPSSEYKAGSNLEALSKNGNFKTLLAAINTAQLKDVLEADGPFTIFAPNDEAMKSAQSTVDDLLKPENKNKLQSFLKNHVALGKNGYAEFKSNKIVTNLNDQRVILRTNATGTGRVEGFKNTSQAPIPDIMTNNGVIHTLTDSPLLI